MRADRTRRWLPTTAATLLGAVVLLTACTSGGGADGEEEVSPAIVEQPTPSAAEATAEAALDQPRFEGEVINPLNLESGDCFNDYIWFDRAQNRQSATTKVPCSKPHENQVFFTAEHPAPSDQPYIGEPELKAYALDVCYRNFEDFVDLSYEQSALEIGADYPDLQAWIRDLSRNLTCYLYAYEGGLLQGSMRGTGL